MDSMETAFPARINTGLTASRSTRHMWTLDIASRLSPRPDGQGSQARRMCGQFLDWICPEGGWGQLYIFYIARGQTFCHPGTHLHTIFVFYDDFDKQTFDIFGCKACILKAFKEHIFKIEMY
jgi:hypothetical protein